MVIKSASLYFKEGSSDKEYHAQIVESSNGLFVVNFQYGRRGGTLKSDTKTKSPAPWSQADKIYDQLVKSKIAKGYTLSTSGKVFSSQSGVVNTKIVFEEMPQL